MLCENTRALIIGRQVFLGFGAVFSKTSWQYGDMRTLEVALAHRWGRLRCDEPQVIFYDPAVHGDARQLRQALRQAGVPALGLNQPPDQILSNWLAEAAQVSEEFLAPVVVFGGDAALSGPTQDPIGQEQDDIHWLNARQLALTVGIESSGLHREFRRTPAKSGWIRLGWHDEADLTLGNGLLLAWTSPLPLMRLRNFSARCSAHVYIEGCDADLLAADVGSQGISVTHWQIAVK